MSGLAARTQTKGGPSDEYQHIRLDAQPEGAPDIGYRFEVHYDPYPGGTEANVHEFEVIGWEQHTDNFGNVMIATRVKEVGRRTRKRGWTGSPPYGEQPERWGYDGGPFFTVPHSRSGSA